MISFENFHSVEGVPIYLQMIRHVKQGLAAGTVQNGDELPSRRILSAMLAVNPNTVQKAYRQLEEEGLIQSRPGAGSHITASREQIDQIRSELFRTEVQETVAAMKGMGLKKEEAVELRTVDEGKLVLTMRLVPSSDICLCSAWRPGAAFGRGWR